MGKKKEEKIEFPRWIKTNYGGVLHVIGNYEDCKDNLRNGKGYVIDGLVYQFYDKEKSGDTIPPNPKFYIGKTGRVITSPGVSGEFLHIKNSFWRDVISVANETDPDKDYDPPTDFVQPASSEAIFIPEIKETDDFLKKIIKTVFLIKKVSTLRYKKKLSKSYAFPNLYQSLNADTKTSTTVWQTWIELLGLDAILIVKDSGGDADYPINDYLVYSSRNDSLEQISKKDIRDYLDKKL